MYVDQYSYLGNIDIICAVSVYVLGSFSYNNFSSAKSVSATNKAVSLREPSISTVPPGGHGRLSSVGSAPGKTCGCHQCGARAASIKLKAGLVLGRNFTWREYVYTSIYKIHTKKWSAMSHRAGILPLACEIIKWFKSRLEGDSKSMSAFDIVFNRL